MMNYEQALELTIKSLKEIKIIPEQEDISYMIKVKNALEKQVKMRPKSHWNGEEKLIQCPICKCPFDLTEAEWARRFCPKCGQAMAWDEQKEDG